MKVRFTADRHVDGERFVEGEVYDLSEASAHRWVRRRCAEYIAEAPPAKKATKKKRKTARKKKADAAPE